MPQNTGISRLGFNLRTQNAVSMKDGRMTAVWPFSCLPERELSDM
jgi:hypothetical protein